MEEKKRILVVDDEPFVRQLVRRMIGRDYDILEAQNGVEAVDIARQQNLSLILMDMMMPQMDGLSACYALKQDAATKDIPVVMLTAITHELNKSMSEKVLGASGYVTKPFTADHLRSTIEPLLSSNTTTESLWDLLEFEDAGISGVDSSDSSRVAAGGRVEEPVRLKPQRTRKQRVERPRT